MKAPSQGLEVLLAEPITVACGRSRMIAGPIAFDGHDKAAGPVWMLYGEVNSIAGHAPLRLSLNLLRSKGRKNIVFESVHFDRGRTLTGEAGSLTRRILQVPAQKLDAFGRARRVEVVVVDGRDQCHSTARTGDGDVESAQTMGAVQRAELAEVDSAGAVPCDSSGENNGVRFIALDALQILEEEAPVGRSLRDGEKLIEVGTVVQSHL